MHCRFCNTSLDQVFIDLGHSPASNSFLTLEALNEPEVYFPLKVFTCPKCFLVQVDEYKKSDDIFDSDYVYFSSYSTSWLAHAKAYCNSMLQRFNFDSRSLVVEVASNDGYLLQYFKEKNIPVLGIEPTSNTAEVAKSKGIESVVDFFGVTLATRLAQEGKKADLLLGNNVLAHVPDIRDFVAGMKILLKETGIITMEFPHLQKLIENNQFDTIYHEHFSYLSFHTVKQVFESNGLEMFDVEELPTHGGSLRIYAKHTGNQTITVSNNVENLLQKESEGGLTNIDFYATFKEKSLQVKLDLLKFLIAVKQDKKLVAGYGAAAKGNTLLNYCGVKHDLIDFVVDANPHKQNKFLPGSHIPVMHENHLKELKPAFVIIFPWNLSEEIIEQLSYIRNWGGKFVVPIPFVQIID
jgi:hypothetical protein